MKIIAAVTIPYPPRSGNHRNQARWQGGFYRDKKIVRYWEDVALLLRPVNIPDLPKGEKWKKDLILDITVYAPDKKIRDCINMWKVPEDILSTVWKVNDSRFLPRFTDWFLDEKNPRIEIVVIQR